jgi:glutamate synthase (NADPH/NADH) small chain
MGAGQPRDLVVQGRGYDNVLFAMDFLSAQNKNISCENVAGRMPSVSGKNVVVIGGGDTGSDCVGTVRRQGASKIYQLEILPKPPKDRPNDTPWPMWPRIMRESTSQEEGCDRRWSVMTKKLSGDGTQVSRLHCCQVEWFRKNDQWKTREVEGSDFTIDAQVVLLAMGFVHVVHEGLVKDLGIAVDAAGNVKVDNCQTSEPWVFAAGDTASGASLVVRAINSGRQAAAAIDKWLKG